MEGPFPNVMNQPDRNELGNPPMVIQQYARYPPTLEPGMPSASSLGSARSRLPASKSPPLNRKATPRSLQASPTGVRSIAPPTTAAQPGPSMSPPMFDPLRQRQPRESIDQPDPRSLPSRDIKDDNIDDAYVMFIFHCNPSVPLSVDTSELRKTFRSPPRSDGKSFSIFTLWELIRKLDNKELKTWISLATELGVEPPVMEKGQSTQKVQQYAVRLKVRLLTPPSSVSCQNHRSNARISALDASDACRCVFRVLPWSSPSLLQSDPREQRCQRQS